MMLTIYNDGTSYGLNESFLWAPSFWLPTLNTALRLLTFLCGHGPRILASHSQHSLKSASFWIIKFLNFPLDLRV